MGDIITGEMLSLGHFLLNPLLLVMGCQHPESVCISAMPSRNVSYFPRIKSLRLASSLLYLTAQMEEKLEPLGQLG